MEILVISFTTVALLMIRLAVMWLCTTTIYKMMLKRLHSSRERKKSDGWAKGATHARLTDALLSTRPPAITPFAGLTFPPKTRLLDVAQKILHTNSLIMQYVGQFIQVVWRGSSSGWMFCSTYTRDLSETAQYCLYWLFKIKIMLWSQFFAILHAAYILHHAKLNKKEIISAPVWKCYVF